MKTLADIRNDPMMDGYQKGLAIEELQRHELSLPPTPLVPTFEQARRLQDFKSRLIALKHTLTSLESRQRRATDTLPSVQSRLTALESNIEPDATRDQVLDLMIEQKKLELLKLFLANFSQMQFAIERDAREIFTPLNVLMMQVAPQMAAVSFLSGGALAARLLEALDAIERILTPGGADAPAHGCLPVSGHALVASPGVSP